MKNNLNSGTIEALTPGSTLLISARQVSEGTKVQLEFAEKINAGPDKPVSALALLNASDSRFSSGARRAWMTVEPGDAGKWLGIDFSESNEKWYDTEKGMMMDLNMLNPGVDLNGVEVKLIYLKEVKQFSIQCLKQILWQHKLLLIKALQLRRWTHLRI